jgi:SAM-dependent methyltransferase
MLDRANAIGTSRPVEWRVADAMSLPFDDDEFDLVACQFGVMFFPDKARAFSEARRVLRPGGTLLFNTWDRIEVNEFTLEVTDALTALIPEDPPRFMARTPHGYHDVDVIGGDLARAGFIAAPEIETLSLRSVAASPADPAIALCQGTPLRGEIEARGITLDEATRAAERALERRFGTGPIEGQMQAHVIAAPR